MTIWTLAGLYWGNASGIGAWIDGPSGSDSSSSVGALVETIRATDDPDAFEQIKRDLESSSPTRQENLLRALREVPVPGLEKTVVALIDTTHVSELEKQGKKVLDAYDAHLHG